MQVIVTPSQGSQTPDKKETGKKGTGKKEKRGICDGFKGKAADRI